MYRFLCVVWSLFWLACAGGLLYLQTQPVPEEWLLTHAGFLRVVHEYERVEPAMRRWRAGVPVTVPLEEFWGCVAERPYAVLPQGALEELSRQMSPDAVHACVRRIKTLLLAPCSRTMRNRIIDDPFGIAGYARRLVSPALTSTHAALYVCIEGGSKEATLAAAETATRVLEELQENGVIRAYQDATAFIATPDRQTVRFADFARMVNSHQVVSVMEQALAQEGVDREVMRGFLEWMRRVATEAASAESVTSQENRLRSMGMMPILRYFFYRTPRGYVSVHRVLPAGDVELRIVRRRLMEAMQRAYLAPIITGPEYFAEVYYGTLRVGVWICAVVWGLGMVAMVFLGMLREYLWWLVLGRHAETQTQRQWYAPGYEDYLKACGLRGLGEALKVEHLAKVRVEPLEDFAREKYSTLRIGQTQAQIVELALHESAPRHWRESGICRLVLYRGYGAQAEALADEYEICRWMMREGVPVMPPVMFAEGRTHGKRCAVLAYAWLDKYLPIVPWQAEKLVPANDGNTGRRYRLLRAVEKTLRAMACVGLRGLSRGHVELMVRELETGEVRVRLSGGAGLKRSSLMSRMARKLGVRGGRLSVEDLTYVNRSLLREVYGVGARVRALARVWGVKGGIADMLPIIWRIQSRSARAGYRQYIPWGDELVINSAAAERLRMSPAKDYRGFMELAGERRVTLKRGRSVVTVRVGTETWYLKRHTGESLWSGVRKLLRGEGGVSEAGAEWRGVIALEEVGIPSVPLVVMGHRLQWGFWERGSFIVTAEVAGGRSLEKVLMEGEALPLRSRIRLAKRLGILARRMHLAGLTHRDFYLGHIYVVGDLRGEYRLHVLDAQRVRGGAGIGNRWSLKDVTALYFSSVGIEGIRAVDRMRFLCAYAGGGAGERRWRHRFARAVMRKAARVARHTEKLLARRRARGELE